MIQKPCQPANFSRIAWNEAQGGRRGARFGGITRLELYVVKKILACSYPYAIISRIKEGELTNAAPEGRSSNMGIFFSLI
jgi:hypothetical protein